MNMIKNFKLISIVFILLMFLSCSKSGDPAVDPRDAWVGTWKGNVNLAQFVPACISGNGFERAGSNNVTFVLSRSSTNPLQLNAIMTTKYATSTSAVGVYITECTNCQTTGIVTAGTFETIVIPVNGSFKFEFKVPMTIKDGKLNYIAEAKQNPWLICPAGIDGILSIFSGTLIKQ